MKYYLWVFFDEERCTFKYIGGTDLYDVNKRAYKYYLELIEECKPWNYDYVDEKNWKRTDFFHFCLDHPTYIPCEDCPGVDIDFQTLEPNLIIDRSYYTYKED